MIDSPLHTAPRLPVSFDTDQRNPLPSYHTPTALERHRVPLKAQHVAVHPTGIAPVPLKTIPTRPIEVQPVEKVSFPGGAHRLPYLKPSKHKKPVYGHWDRISIGSQASADEQVVFEYSQTNTHEVREEAVEGSVVSTCEIEHAEATHPTYDYRPIALKERVALPMQRIPMMSVPSLRVATGPVRTHTVAVKRSKKALRPKKTSSARIW